MRKQLVAAVALAAAVAFPHATWSDAGHDHGQKHDQAEAAVGGAHGHESGNQAAAADHAHGHWSAPAHAQAMANPIPTSSASVDQGAALFRENCTACHGAVGRGDGEVAATLEKAPADLVQMAPTHSDGDFAWKIANGRGEMPAWGDVLTAEEIWHVVNYLKNLPRLAAVQSGETEGEATGQTRVD